MIEEIKDVLEIIVGVGNEAYYGGESCVYESCDALLNTNHNVGNDFLVLTNANMDDITQIFTKYQTTSNPYTIVIDKDGKHITISSYYEVKYTNNGIYCSPEYKQLKTLKEYFNSLFYTIECVVQDKDENFIYYNHSDKAIKTQQITLNSKNKNSLTSAPSECLKAFALMSNTNFTITKDTLAVIKQTFKYIKGSPVLQVQKYISDILTGKYAYDALMLMKKNNCIKKILSTVGNQDCDILQKMVLSKSIEAEIFALLYKDNVDNVRQELGKLQYPDKFISEIEWLINNRDICSDKSDKDYRLALYDAGQQLSEQNQNISYFKMLILKVSRMHRILCENKVQAKKDNSKIMFNMCCRPYFLNQLDVEIENDRKIILLKKLLVEPKYPLTKEAMAKYIEKEAV